MQYPTFEKTVCMLFAAAFLVAGVIGCQGGPKTTGNGGNGGGDMSADSKSNGDDASASGEWQLQFEDGFEREKVGDKWDVVEGEWAVKDGWLMAKDTGFGAAQVLTSSKYAGSQKLEYDAKSSDPGDLSAILSANNSWQDGYFVGFGVQGNDRSYLKIQGMNVKNWGATIEPGKTHHVVVERDGKMIRQYVDGEKTMEYKHRNPLTGENHQKVGFYIWTKGKIDNVKVYTK